ncbi:MAG: YfhO family protein [Pyrinomonadaceae bacterium]
MVSLLPLIYFFPATRGKLIISPDDGVIFNIPIRVVVANLIHSGYVPLWNPYIFSGMPLFGAAQAGVLFPLNWFYLIFSAPVATNLMMLSTYALAALGAFLYARRSGSNLTGAALTSLVWQWSGFLIGQIGHTNIVHTAALLPWLLWAIDGYGESGRRRHGLVLAVLLAIQVFAGHQQTLAYALLVAAAYAVMMWRRSHSSTRTAYLWSLILVGAGLALAAVQILPTVELLRNSLRADATYDFFTSFSMPPRFLWTFFAPYVMGGGDGHLFRAPYLGPAYYGEYVGYVGLATIALALLAFALKRDARTIFWGVVVLAGVILALGRFVPFGFYKLIYAVPVLNLFRVPARHLMEVEFGLAVLAGRGLTAITNAQDRAKTLRWVLLSGVTVFVLACLAVTLGRPSNFQLGRTGPVSILRAPELFLPPLIAALSAWALWKFARRQRCASLLLLLIVLCVDLNLWGQSSGWRVGSPSSDFELWNKPAIVESIRPQAAPQILVKDMQPYRILTHERPFDPDRPAASLTPGDGWVPTLQPDIYMMYGVENAAGYDGFGLARYSRLAGDMKVWGELTDPERTLGNESRELDLLNVRYLLTRSMAPAAATAKPSEAAQFSPATQAYGGQKFAEDNLNLPGIVAGERLSFKVPPIEAERISLLTNLAWSETIPDRTVVGHIRLHAKDGTTFTFEILAGEDTSEWAYDRPDIRKRIKHKRATVATSYAVEDAQAKYEAHTYVSSFVFPANAIITGGEVTVERVPGAPDLTLSVTRIALADGERAFPVRREWVRKESAAETKPPVRVPERDSSTTPRWQRLTEIGKVAIFENARMLPRAWLADSEVVLNEQEELAVIRTGKLPSGQPWKPLQTVLVEAPTGSNFGAILIPGSAEVVRDEPNRIEVKTESSAPTILVLSENHYPGWRAHVDGKPVEVIRANYNLRGAAVPAGKHLVEFVYRPKSVLVGLVISLLTLAGLVLWSMGSIFNQPAVAGGSIKRRV